MNYWGISNDTAIEDYVANNAYNSANWKMSIGNQKWIALYMNGFEGWNMEKIRLSYRSSASGSSIELYSCAHAISFV
jgi:hypothetical protein